MNKNRIGLDPLASWLPSRPDRWAPWAVAILALLAFANSLWNGLVYDDNVVIGENPAVRHVSDLQAIFGTGYWPGPTKDPLYRPLIIFSYALNYAVVGLAPFTYHLVNVLLHAGNSALVYRLFVALFRGSGLAIAAAAAFALHPIHTEAVANGVGRAELLANAFLFASWLWYLRWDETPARARTRRLAASVAAFALALFTKEHAVVLLGLLVLTDLLRASEKGLSVGRTMWERCRTAYAWYLLPLGGYLLTRVLVLGALVNPQVSWHSNPLLHSDRWTRWVTGIKILGKYLWLLVAPLHLSADYSYNQIPLSASLLEPAVLASLLALVGALALAVHRWRRQPAVSVGVAVFAVAILPASNLPFPIGTIMAERILYLPSLGFCLLLAAAVAALAERPRWGLVAVGAFLLLLLGYGARTVVRNWDWASDAALFAATARSSPNSAPAHHYLAVAMLRGGDLSGAQREIERSLEIYPEYGEAYNSLAAVFEKQGRMDAATAAIQTAIKMTPDLALGHMNLGFIYIQKGMASAALEEFREAARVRYSRIDEFNRLAKGFYLVGSPAEAQGILEKAVYYTPDSFGLRNNLGLVYLRQERWDEARRELEAAARLKPDSPEVQMNLGRVYAAQGVPRQAEVALKTSLRLKPDNPDALEVLGQVLAGLGRLAEAEVALQTAIRLRPERAEAHYNLGVVFEKLGKRPDAKREFEAALRVKPGFAAARRALDTVRSQRGQSGEAYRPPQPAGGKEKGLSSRSEERSGPR